VLSLRALLLGALLGASAAPGAGLPPESDAWMTLTSAHFRIFSNASEGRTKEVALSLERLRAALARLKSSGAVTTPLPTWIFVFKDAASMAPYKPRVGGKPIDAVGLFQRSHDGNWVLLESRWGADPRRIVFHEYVHFFMANNFPPQPTWYDEGYAEYLSTFESTDTEARIGRVIEAHLGRLRETGLMPLERLFAVNPQSPDYNESDRKGVFYAESWALVHYLLDGAPNRTPQLKRFLVLLQNGVETRTAFHDAFAIEPKELLAELAGYIQRSHFSYQSLRFADALGVSKETLAAPMPRSETLARLGELLAHVDAARDADAELHLRSAQLLAPREPRAAAGLGYLRLRQGKLDEAVPLLKEAAAGAPDDAALPLLTGEALLRRLEKEPLPIGGLSPEQRSVLEEARSALRRSLAISGERAETRALLGRTYLVEADDAIGPGVAELEKAHALLPARREIAVDLASLYDRKGELDKRDAVLRRSLGREADALIAKMNGASSIRAAYDEIDRLCLEGKADEAEPKLEALIARAPADVRPGLEAQLPKVRAAAGRDRAIRRYNEAVTLLNAGKAAEARDAFRALASETADAEIASKAREQAEKIAKYLDDRGKPRAPGRKPPR
jgi:predicted Zn-dependent protease